MVGDHLLRGPHLIRRRGAVGAPFGDPVLRRPPTSGPSTATPAAGTRRGGAPRPPAALPQPQLPTLRRLVFSPVNTATV